MQRWRGSRGSGGVQGGLGGGATATDMAYNNGRRRNKSPSSTTDNNNNNKNHRNNKMESSESPAGQQNSLRFGKLFQVSQSVYITITVLYMV